MEGSHAAVRRRLRLNPRDYLAALTQNNPVPVGTTNVPYTTPPAAFFSIGSTTSLPYLGGGNWFFSLFRCVKVINRQTTRQPSRA